MESTLLWILAAVLVLVGLAGTVLPALPGVPLMLLGMVIAAWADDFTRIGATTIVILGLLTALAMVIDFAAGALGARRAGASREAIAGAVLGTLIGAFMGLPGLIAGPFVGAVAGEILARGRMMRAMHVGAAAWIGFALGAVAKLAVAFTMLGVFAAAWWIP